MEPGGPAAVTMKPEIDAPEGPAPGELVIVDEVIGEGAETTAGCAVYVDYVGVLYDSGEESDASYNRGQPLAFRLGVGHHRVIRRRWSPRWNRDCPRRWSRSRCC